MCLPRQQSTLIKSFSFVIEQLYLFLVEIILIEANPGEISIKWSSQIGTIPNNNIRFSFFRRGKARVIRHYHSIL